jgi:hypothetical protein
LQVDAQTVNAEIKINKERMEAKIEATRREFQSQLKEVEAWTECGRGIGTGPAKPPKFNETIPWTVFLPCRREAENDEPAWETRRKTSEGHTGTGSKVRVASE